MNHKYSGEKIALFLNGEYPILFPYNDYKNIFITDGAYNNIVKYNIIPNIIIGDFDSIKKNVVLSNSKKSRKVTFIHTPNQNFTDFEKSLKIIHKQNIFMNIDIWGGSGKEQDHFLGNLSTALKYKKKLSLIFYDNYHKYFFAEKENYIVGVKNKIISLYPFPKVNGLITKGLKYPIYNKSLNINKKIGIRNRAVENDIYITFSTGTLIIFIQR